MARGASKKRLVLQERDHRLMLGLGIADLLNTNIIWSRYFPKDKTGQACRNRLRLLRGQGLVQPTFVEISSATGTGRAPIYWRLLPKGAAVLDVPSGYRLRTAKSDRLSVLHIKHRCGVGEMVLAINDGCRDANLQMPNWLLEYDPQPGAKKKAPFSHRFLLCHDLHQPDGAKISCWPDAGAELVLNMQGKAHHLVLLFEYDCSTEDHPQLLDKIPGYKMLLQTKRYRQHWPQASQAFVLFVFQNEKRLRNAAATFRTTSIAKYIRMAIASDLVTQSPITDETWWTVNLERRAILKMP